MKLLSIKKILFISLFVICASSLNKSYSQDLVEDISSGVTVADNREMFTETIRIIGRSHRVFILTNTNQALFKGDFITLVLGEKDAVARAVVAKNHNELIGIKVLRIYSLKNWKRLKKNLDVKILKGDDSWLFKKEVETKPNKGPEEIERINSEEDLYKDDLTGKDLDSFGKDNRLIKPDNIVSASFSRYTLDNDLGNGGEGELQQYNRFSAQWAYQFADNFWFQGLYGRVQLDGVPASGTQTVLNDITFRLKYTFQAPLYSYFKPYIGFQIHSISSPNAGKNDPPNPVQDDAETALIEKMAKSDIVFGVTILRRLVPGWFVQADIGTDVLSLGFGIEF
jgi:hypothetical protein